MLLRKTRKLTQLIQNEGNGIDFDSLCNVLRDIFGQASVYVFSRRGKVLGHALPEGYISTPFDSGWLRQGRIPEELNDTLLKVAAPSAGPEAARTIETPIGLIVPVVGSGRRLGTLVGVREENEFTEEEVSLAEFAATMVGMVISHALDEEEEDEAIERRMARSAIRSLSYSEILAMQHIFDELNGDEGLLVASRIADQAGITRSVIVNALRKLASANVIESRSLGMKGTYLRILNREIRNELDSMRYPYPSGAALLKKRA